MSRRLQGVQPLGGRTSNRLKPGLYTMAVGLLAWLGSGCSLVGPEQQRLVSKPSMQFSDEAAYSYTSRIMPQIQPGLANTGGAQASTCTLCR